MPSAGDVIGPYVLVRALGRGGMGETWVGVRRSGSLEQRVCVKLITPELRAAPEAVRLFRQEAALAASVRHGNLVQVVDVGNDGAYIAYELVDGTDLRTLLREAAGHRLSSELVVYVLIEVCKALDYLHTRTHRGELSPIVHRDVSPSNILISHRGEVKLADLGIAKAVREAERSEHVKGKVSYLSPEQANLEDVDGRTDVYALGVTAYEALSGARPFAGESPEQILSQVIQGRAVPLRQAARHASVGLVEVIETMMARRPQERFSSAMDVIRALAENAPPPVLAFEKLGEHARHAQPHETVHEDLSAGMEATRTAPAEPRPPAPTMTAPASAADAPAAVPPSRGSETRTARPRRRERRTTRVAMASLVAALALLGGGIAVWQSGSDTQSSPQQTAQRPTPEDPSAAQAEPAPASTRRAEPSTPKGASPDERGEAPAAPQPTPRPSGRDQPAKSPQKGAAAAADPERQAEESPAPQPRQPRRRQTRRRPTGTLKVGAFPSGKVWVDGELRGDAPLTVRLSAGRHRVAAGLQKPSETRRVRIRAGATEQLVFNLRAQAEEESP